MGEVGGNGSVVWQNQHHAKKGKFKCKGRGKLKPDELGLGEYDLDVWGHDGIPMSDIGKTPPDDLESDLRTPRFQRDEYFLVRLRFDGPEADAIKKWFDACGTDVPEGLIKLVSVVGSNRVILAINVKALQRREPEDGISWENRPFEIRYHW